MKPLTKSLFVLGAVNGKHLKAGYYGTQTKHLAGVPIAAQDFMLAEKSLTTVACLCHRSR